MAAHDHDAAQPFPPEPPPDLFSGNCREPFAVDAWGGFGTASGEGGDNTVPMGSLASFPLEADRQSQWHDSRQGSCEDGAISPPLSISDIDPGAVLEDPAEHVPSAWDLLENRIDFPDSHYFADDEHDWYSEVRDNDAVLVPHATDESEPFEVVDPDASSLCMSEPPATSNFYLRSQGISFALPDALEPAREADDLKRVAVELSAKRRRTNIPKLPWETGPMSMIFSAKPVVPARDWSCSGVLLSAGASEQIVSDGFEGVAPQELGQVTAAFGKRLLRMRAPTSEEQIRAAALKRLKLLVCLDPTASKLGVSLLDQMQNLCDDETIARSISDAFRAKASQTLIKRAGSLERFARWCFDQDLPSPFRADEQIMYRYLCDLRTSGAKPTSPNHFLQAWRFVHGAIGLIHSPPSEVISTRCEGASRDQYLTKAPLRQKSPLTRQQVEELERGAVESADTKEVCVLGQILFCLHASCRWSDSQRIVSIVRQEANGVVLLVVDALTAKHTYSQESQRVLLPYAALGRGLSGHDWSEAWLSAREAEGLVVGKDMCLPSLRSDGSGWLGVKMSSTEGQIFLQEALAGIDKSAVPLSQLGTHSLKATLLTWAQRSPVVPFKMWERKLMGHHSLDRDKSPLTYSRQAYATLMGKVQAMFESIVAGSFDPDMCAAGRVAQVAASYRAKGSDEVQRMVRRQDGDEAAEAEASGSSDPAEPRDHSSRSSSGESARQVVDAIDPSIFSRVQFEGGWDRCHTHVVSGIVHKLRSGDDSIFECGLLGAMASVTLESKAAFLERCRRIEMTEATIEGLRAAGFDTFGSLGFAVCANPQALEEGQVIKFIGDTFPAGLTLKQSACIRKLLFESQALSLQDLKARVEPPPVDAPPRKMPVAERLAREKAQREKLNGLIWGPEMQPGQGVVDACVDMLEQNVLVYMPPHKFVSRSQEISCVKRDKSVLVDTDGGLKVTAKNHDMSCDASTEYALRQAWQRRSLAFDLAGLGTFHALEDWVNKMFLVLSRPIPPGYKPVNIHQLISADRALFIRAADALVGSLTGVPGRAKPLDEQIVLLQDSPEIVQYVTLCKDPKKADPNKPKKFVVFQAAAAPEPVDSPLFPTICFGLVQYGSFYAWRHERNFRFTSLSLFLNVKTDFHIDSYNSPGDDNCVFKINDFGKGGRLGGGYVRFNARALRHATESWTGDRMVLVAFTINDPSALTPQAGASLEPLEPRPVAFEAQSAALKLDLQEEAGQSLFWSLWADANAAYVHCGPPCGTASRARERAIPRKMRAAGVPQPPPLRSSDFPFGLPNMLQSAAYGPRLHAANRLYRFTAKILLACLQEERYFSIENPASSHFWSILDALVLEWPSSVQAKYAKLLRVDFAQCMHGGTRPKVSRFLTNVPSFAQLACRCDASHSHDAWGAQWSPSGWRFATHLEAQYPRLLCRRLVDALCSSLTPSQVRALAPSVSLHTDALATLAVQSRRFPPLVSEFRQIVHLPADAPKPANSKTLLPGVGIYRTPEEFVAAANDVRHPMDTQNPLARVQLLAKQLAPEEAALKASMSDGVRKVLGTKKLVLWERLLRQAKLTPATITEHQLRETARWRRKSLVAKPLSMTDDCFDPLEEACNDEVRRGSLEGPFYSEAAVSEYLGHDRWCCVRRFIIQQNDKYRPIDDCCECQLNEGYSSTFKLRLQDADYFACLVLNICKRILSSSLRVTFAEWSGKCLDLSRAYKQLAILPAHVDLAVCLVHTRAGKPVFYVPNSLMFGSNAAVYAFNRVSRSIFFLLSRLLIIPLSCFYDDFPILTPTRDASEVDGMISDLLDILGWEHKRTGEGHKGLPFAKLVDILGMRADLSCMAGGTVTLSNKPGRIDKICDFVVNIKSAGCVTRHQAQVLLGLLNFACGYYHGRALRYLCKGLIDVVSGGSLEGRALQDFCDEVVTTLRTTPPRVLRVNSCKDVLHLYVDGSWEDGFAGIGAVLFDPASQMGRVWEGVVPSHIISRWRKEVGDHLICQIELYAALCMRVHLADSLVDRKLILWTDNDATRLCLVKGRSPSPSMHTMIKCFGRTDVDKPCYVWIDRVPSKSNPADAPSRGDGKSILKSV
ncbi:unnamed protein product, partial [Symbiodinium necroappetens]